MTKKEELTAKLKNSYTQHYESWLHMDPKDLVEISHSISAARYAAKCVPKHLDEMTSGYLLQFEDPLNILTDKIIELNDEQFGFYNDTITDMLTDMVDKGDELQIYELSPDYKYIAENVEMSM